MKRKMPAVFARNHRHYLEEASAISPAKPVAFRSATHWASAENSIKEYSTVPIYFAVIGEGPYVAYAAELLAVHLDPRVGDPDTENFLRFSLPSTIDEGLWESYETSVKSLYLIKRCRPLSDPFSMTKLIKVSDDKPIAPNYGYSYSIVYQRGTEPGESRSYLGEVENPGDYWEGATRQVFVTTYERNGAARAACIRHFGYDCAVCGFNFGSTYGELGERFIHVHHKTPLSRTSESYRVDPVSDLIPLCANCHEIVHKEDPPVTVERLRSLLRSMNRSGT